MGTKAQPGNFDCYHSAADDEPMFVLLARDKHAPTLVWLWSVLRELDGETPDVVNEARTCAVNMIEWADGRGRKAVGIGQSVLAGVLELIRAANAASSNLKNSPSTLDAVRAFFTATQFERAQEAPPTPPAASESGIQQWPLASQIDSACVSFRHDFGLLSAEEQTSLRFAAVEWLRAWQKELQ